MRRLPRVTTARSRVASFGVRTRRRKRPRFDGRAACGRRAQRTTDLPATIRAAFTSIDTRHEWRTGRTLPRTRTWPGDVSRADAVIVVRAPAAAGVHANAASHAT